MKIYKLTSVLFFLLSSIAVKAQYDFENWAATGVDLPYATEYLVDFRTTNQIFPFVGFSAHKTMESHAGMYAMRIAPKFILGKQQRAIVALGQPEINFIDLGFKTSTGGIEINSGKLAVSWFYKNEALDQQDPALAKLVIYRTEDGSIAYEKTDSIPSVTEWTKHEISIQYEHRLGDTLALEIYSGLHPNNALYLDDLNIRSTSSTTSVLNNSSPCQLYPNPISATQLDQLVFSHPKEKGAYAIFTMDGQLIHRAHWFTDQPIALPKLKPGMYSVQIGNCVCALKVTE